MLKNYLKVAWRNLVKNKTFSIINIAGLAVGLACFGAAVSNPVKSLRTE